MADARKPRVPTNETRRLGTSLADALAKRGLQVAPEAPRPAAPPLPDPPVAGDLARCGKIVLRRERKGRGGKTATVVAGLGLPARALDALARDLRRALGCGAVVEDDTIVLQGDLVARVEPWLSARGARRIVVGS
jgi:translation initiation factor 1